MCIFPSSATQTSSALLRFLAMNLSTSAASSTPGPARLLQCRERLGLWEQDYGARVRVVRAGRGPVISANPSPSTYFTSCLVLFFSSPQSVSSLSCSVVEADCVELRLKPSPDGSCGTCLKNPRSGCQGRPSTLGSSSPPSPSISPSRVLALRRRGP